MRRLALRSLGLHDSRKQPAGGGCEVVTGSHQRPCVLLRQSLRPHTSLSRSRDASPFRRAPGERLLSGSAAKLAGTVKDCIGDVRCIAARWQLGDEVCAVLMSRQVYEENKIAMIRSLPFRRCDIQPGAASGPRGPQNDGRGPRRAHARRRAHHYRGVPLRRLHPGGGILRYGTSDQPSEPVTDPLGAQI